MQKISKVIAILLIAISSNVFAQGVESGVYVGAGIGRTSSSLSKNDFNKDVSIHDINYGGRIFSGYKMNRFFGLEIAYTAYNEIKIKSGASDGDIRVRALTLELVGMVPVGYQWSLFGRLGGFRDDKNIATTITDEIGYKPSTGNEYGLSYALGVQYDFENHVGARLGWSQIQNDNLGNSMVTFSLLYTFTPY